MKVLYISYPNFADCDFPLIRAFLEKGLDVTYLIPLPPFHLKASLINIKKQISKTKIFPATDYPELRYLENYMDMDKVFVSNRTGKSRLTLSYWKSVWNLRQFIKKGEFDIIHTTNDKNKWFYKLAPLVTTIHDPFPHTGEDYDNQKEVRLRTVKRSKGIVLLNDIQLGEFCKCFDVDPHRVLVNSLGVYDNIRYFANPETKPVKNNVLFFGRISPYKGIEFLCKAMELVRKQVPDATLTIAGKGQFYFDYTPYKDHDYIQVLNRYITMPELAELLSACELSVCPYTDATQSGVVMTSFALGKPVVASAVGGLVEMIDDGQSGVLVPPKDVKALAGAIVSLLKNEQKKQMMTEYIFNTYFKGGKSWPAIADRYIKYYSELLEG